MGCCGVQPYDPGDPKTKCCSGHLHSLQAGHHGKAQCCGVHLIANVSLQCCASAQKQLPYPRTPGLSCCGHFQYNTTQHYCCAGHLRRVTPAVRHRV
ncbi:usherin-like [Anguilla anguilla]|uniref:usherin-like n=1 Tax=Anguilla anguilla TaxID=7936 RepID=UPI0015A9413F|nr:usherin-like [Anguilla anguilla]